MSWSTSARAVAVIALVAGTGTYCANALGPHEPTATQAADSALATQAGSEPPSSRVIFLREFAQCMKDAGHDYTVWDPDQSNASDPNKGKSRQGGESWLKSDMACREKVNEEQSRRGDELLAAYNRNLARDYKDAARDGRIIEPNKKLLVADSMTIDQYLSGFQSYNDSLQQELACMESAGMPIERRQDGSTNFLELYRSEESPLRSRLKLSKQEFNKKYEKAMELSATCAEGPRMAAYDIEQEFLAKYPPGSPG